MNNNRNYNTDIPPGEIISWIVIVACLASGVGTIIGIILLVSKLRGYDKRAQNARRAAVSAPPYRTAAPPAAGQPPHGPAVRGGGISALLLLLALALLVICGGLVFSALSDLTVRALAFAGSVVLKLIAGGGCFIGAAAVLTLRGLFRGRMSRYAGYVTVTGARELVPVTEIAGVMGVSPKKARRDLGEMARAGYFGKSAYIDKAMDYLIIRPAAGEQARQARAEGQRSAREAAQAARDAGESEYARVLQELRELDEKITDAPISEKVSRIADVTAKIFRAVEEAPSKRPQIRRFMSYYLPTTTKLLRTFATLEKQGIEGENITEARGNIDRILGALAKGFEQQLDQLFKADAIDISSDINVLESMLRQDGLTDEGPLSRPGGGNG